MRFTGIIQTFRGRVIKLSYNSFVAQHGWFQDVMNDIRVSYKLCGSYTNVSNVLQRCTRVSRKRVWKWFKSANKVSHERVAEAIRAVCECYKGAARVSWKRFADATRTLWKCYKCFIRMSYKWFCVFYTDALKGLQMRYNCSIWAFRKFC